MKIQYIIGILILWSHGRVIGLASLKKLKKGIYEENLSSYRMEFYSAPKHEAKEPLAPLVVEGDQSIYLETLLAKRKAVCQRMPLKGFTIQVYMGRSRTAALQAQALAASLQSVYLPLLHYRQPNYMVQLGCYRERLEAYFAYLSLVKSLPSAMIRPYLFKQTDLY